MIGVGVFTTSGFSLADLGNPNIVLLAWFVGGLLALSGALSYGAIAAKIPVSGGEYVFLSRLVHPLAGFLAGWVSLLAGFSAPIAAAAHGLQAYIGPSLGLQCDARWIGTCAILVAGILHLLPRNLGALPQNVAVIAKLVALVILVAIGSRALRSVPESSIESFDLPAFAVTLVWISLAYAGWNAAVYIASEVRTPTRTLGRSLLLGTAIVTALYLAINAVFVHAAPIEALAGQADIGRIAARHIGGPGFETFVALTVGLALFTSVSAMVMAGPRVYARMSQDGLFPRFFTPQGGNHSRSVCLQVLLAVFVLWLGSLREIIGYAGFTLGLSSALTVLGFLWRSQRDGDRRTARVWVALVYVVATLSVSTFMIVREPGEALLGLATMASGIPVYFYLKNRTRQTT